MVSVPIPIKDARNSLKLAKGKTRTIVIKPGAVGAKGDISLGVHRLDLSFPHPIVSIAHINLTDTTVFVSNLVNAAGTSDQITYVAIAAHDAAQQFDIKAASTIRLNEATKVLSLLVITGIFEDN
jgi:hypothetical protein